MDLLDRVVEYLRSDNLFLTGGAGVGKSYLTKKIIDYYRACDRGVVVLGSTGISAVNLGGQTIHSFFVFLIASNLEELQRGDRYNKSRLKEMVKILDKTDLLIIDEISMVSADLMDMILYRLRSANYRGKVLVVGDFYQLPPIQNSRQNSIFSDNIYAFESSSWEYFNFVMVELTKIKRSNNLLFMNILEKIRVGNADDEVIEYLSNLKDSDKTINSEFTTLFGRNVEADLLNKKILSSIKTKEYNLQAIIDIKDKNIHPKRVDSWKKSLPIDENLILKEGIPIIFTTNKWGVYNNGERAIVEHVDDDCIVVLKDGKLVKVERFEFELTKSVVDENGELDSKILASLRQFPIRLAYAITIHKSQGMSIDNLICNVDHIFADSQFYVALSRAVNPDNLKIYYSRGDFSSYIKRVVFVSERVKKFYHEIKSIKLE